MFEPEHCRPSGISTVSFRMRVISSFPPPPQIGLSWLSHPPLGSFGQWPETTFWEVTPVKSPSGKCHTTLPAESRATRKKRTKSLALRALSVAQTIRTKPADNDLLRSTCRKNRRESPTLCPSGRPLCRCGSWPVERQIAPRGKVEEC